MSLRPPTIKVILELISFLLLTCISFLIICLSLPIIIFKIILVETFNNIKNVVKMLGDTKFVKRFEK